MKKTFNLVLTTVLLGVFCCLPVKAAECSNDLYQAADKVKVSNEFVEEIDNETDIVLSNGSKPMMLVDNIKIENVTNQMTIVVTETKNNTSNTYNYSNSNNGTITIKDTIVRKVKNYTIDIYASDSTNCGGTKLKVKYLETLAYNPYSKSTRCEGNEKFEYCKEYLNREITEEEFQKKLSEYLGEDEGENDKEGILAFINKHKVLLIIIISLLVIGGTTTIIIRRRKGVDKNEKK
ncbi:MAG: hypothetical protein IJ574_05760 [Bacilli bacterium]|nr:hypothetical protein [Bacilli bacterium]